MSTQDEKGLSVEDFQNINIEVSDNPNPELVALGWLVGSWEGSGNSTDHEGNDFTFEQCIEFIHNGGDYLLYVSQVFGMGEDGKFDQPLGMETGSQRPKRDASVEVTPTNSDGWTEVLVGKIQVTQISLLTDAVARTEGAAISHTSGQWLYGKARGDLMYALDRSTADYELRPHVWARLVKQ